MREERPKLSLSKGLLLPGSVRLRGTPTSRPVKMMPLAINAYCASFKILPPAVENGENYIAYGK